MLTKAKILTGSVGLAALLAISAAAPSSAAPLQSGAQMSVMPSLVEKINNRKQRELDGLFQCCWRLVRGQSLIGLYCGAARLDKALKRDVVRVVRSASGKQTCTMGAYAHRY